ncbi:RING/U-box superfamily protein isoform 5 [Hibiscus syriacus]|uniref:RING/U-box superfamily protein isoform 5 n=1 Tax=Hibiscus syriacus TaxID=106335 RepID=A0A6A3C1E2_HIBSY|nr:RING/U-box superfamily protein isoform 5 [Hibiscus syriacus]
MEEPFDEYADDKVMEIILQVINLSVITDNLCKKMYECIENELLGSLQCTTHNISPYISKGIEKASELYVYWNSEAGTTTEKSVGSYCGTNSKHGRPLSFGSSEGSDYPSRSDLKSRVMMFSGLSMPAEVLNRN